MHILVTGADGFIGRHLVRRLLALSGTADSPYYQVRITALDQQFTHLSKLPNLRCLAGSFADSTVLRQALDTPADLVFHLASVPSGLSEQQPDLGMAVNVHGTLALLDALRAQSNCPALVFASSIAVYGRPETTLVTDDTLPNPALSYGAHKVIGEVLVNDYARRGWIRGCSLRLPGIVARPAEPNGAVSIFISDLIRCMYHGEAFVCPVSEKAHSWLMSVQCCIDNLLRGAAGDFDKGRTWMLPALRVSLQALAAESARLGGNPDALSRLQWQPDPWVEFNFGSYPPLQLPRAEAAGFRADASLAALVEGAVTGLQD
jgi:nucleoside-diphosphate-sugar epimerase